MKVYNSLSNKKENFLPINNNKIKMYVCGPTVYDFIHIGNARPLVVFDSVRRYFEYKGFDVTYVQNFTDVDDKIINKANLQGVLMEEISNQYILEALQDTNALNIKQATHHPKVTEEIPEIIEMIQTLIDKGNAYEVDGTVYFNTKTFADYGKLSGKILEELEIGARIKLDDAKINPTDFVLWKPKKENEPFWQSPWGQGRPGWHIECSVMAKKYLGEHIDIHAGGEDLIFPHHENEIAQSECCNDKKFANYWLHNGFINVDNEKMSKSKGNFFTIREISSQFDYDVIRFFILSAHYRNPINFSQDLMQASKNSLDRIKNCVKNLNYIIENTNGDITMEEQELLNFSSKFKTEFENHMEDDFNTADAISAIFEFVRFINTNVTLNSTKEFAKEILQRLLNLTDVLAILFDANKQDDQNIDEKTIEDLIEQRQMAKKNKDFALADKIRDDLKNMGILLEDTRAGVRWSKI